jgi:hypothetical protein
MSRIRVALGVGILTALAPLVASASADAANGPTFRDCSLVGGLDPDFVQLSGVTVGPKGMLSVAPGQNHVSMEASESSDPGDSEGHDTFNVSVSSRNVATQTVAGEGIGKVVLSVPLLKSKQVGRSYTISWAAIFDTGFHECPSSSTPENTMPNPFIVTVG